MKSVVKTLLFILILTCNTAYAKGNKLEQEYLQKLAESFGSNTNLKHEASNTFWSRCLGSEAVLDNLAIVNEIESIRADSIKRVLFYQRINYYLTSHVSYYPQVLDIKTMRNVVEEKKNKKGKVVSTKTVEKLASVFDEVEANQYYSYISRYEQLPELLDTCQPVLTYEKLATHPDSAFKFIETKPEFPGGDAAIIKFLMNEVRFPDYERENEIEGKVVVRFIVCPNGRATGFSVTRSAGKMFDTEALRVMKMLPTFTKSGTQQGKPVNVYYSLPINFFFR